jgi:hypothetical protein
MSPLQLLLNFRLMFLRSLPQQWYLFLRDPTNDERQAILQGRA